MWETNSYKAHEDHMMLYEAMKKSMNRDHTDELLKDLAEAQRKKKKRHDSPKTPLGSPPHQPPHPSPPAGVWSTTAGGGQPSPFSEPNPGIFVVTAATANNRRHCLHLILGSCSISLGRIEAVDSDGHLRSCPSGSGGAHRSRGIRRYDRLVSTYRIRVGSWNVGSLTSKLFELSDTLGRHKVDIACFQETKWKGSRAREGNGYKLWYSGSSTARNGVGVMVAGRLKENVVRMTRRSDRIMAIYAVIDGETVNVISAYAPQVGLSDVDKKRAAADGYAGVHRGFSFGDRNEEGRSILEFDTAHDLVVANSFFMKSEACSLRHRLVIVDVLFEKQRHRRRATGRPRILWKNLKGEVVESFRATIFEKLLALEEDMSVDNADQMWNTLAGVIRYAAKESLGVASESARTRSTHRESWWFTEEVQTIVATKQARFKELLSCRDGNQEDIDMVKERSKVSKSEAKIVVARAKDKAYEDLYKKLDSKEGADYIYKIAKARERMKRDIGNVRYIKDEGGLRKKYRLNLKNDMPPRDKCDSLLCHNYFTLSEALAKKQAPFGVSDDMSMTYTSFLLGKAFPLLSGSA
uniref:Retrovirus-related Pol polyprotein LINE-1 n=1 Tax=Tanacetum cinerariifolium TaxID=118510 RepID=A0A6L2NA82_TANCI|nr:retrovirus-related Pol polyprotein LINE-1 [Tanacetum cinerariifolium]